MHPQGKTFMPRLRAVKSKTMVSLTPLAE